MAKRESAKRGTKTSGFGVSKRESHDASKFYKSRLYEGLPKEDKDAVEPPPPAEIPPWANKIYCADSRDMSFIPDNSIALMVTSPPYNVSKDYDADLTLKEYLDLLAAVFAETKRVLIPGGRMCINVAGVGRKPYIPLHHYIGQICTHDLGLLMRGEIIWDKSASSGVSCAWGSFRSPTNPTLRDVHEYILVFSKGKYRRDARPQLQTTEAQGSREEERTAKAQRRGDVLVGAQCVRPQSSRRDATAEPVEGKVSEPREGDAAAISAAGGFGISSEEFTEYTKSVWRFPTVSAKRAGHPAPFPEELPARLIKLYTFPGVYSDISASAHGGPCESSQSKKLIAAPDIVLDPFCGSGTTCIAAAKLRRGYVGVDKDEEYCARAQTNISAVGAAGSRPYLQSN
ncbi:MAG: site-specific DNA-methyltransferase [bacterium]